MSIEARRAAAKRYKVKNREKIRQAGRDYYKRKRAQCTASSKSWVKRNPDKRRNRHLIRLYGITLDKYNEILKSQNDCCAVCLRHYSEFTRNLCVDHDHKTLEIFGVLCNHCNHRVIGRNRDSEKFARVSEYLRKGTGLFVPEKKKKSKRKKS